MFRLLALILPLGLDTFAVAAALGIAGLPRNERLRVSSLFTVFETGMPLIGLMAGSAVGRLVGGLADFAAILTLAGIGLYLVLHRDDEQGAQLLARTRGVGVIALGIGISLDELAIGFTLGLMQVPVIVAIVLIAVQAFAVTQLGLRVGSRVGAEVQELAERLAGIGLIALAALLGASHLVGFRL